MLNKYRRTGLSLRDWDLAASVAKDQVKTPMGQDFHEF